jgi:hypothetical protein
MSISLIIKKAENTWPEKVMKKTGEYFRGVI